MYIRILKNKRLFTNIFVFITFFYQLWEINKHDKDVNIHENMCKYVKYRYKYTWKYVEIYMKIGRNMW